MIASFRLDTRALVLHFAPILDKLTDDDFFELCRVNRDLRLERTAEGDLIIMPPTGSETGRTLRRKRPQGSATGLPVPRQRQVRNAQTRCDSGT